MVREPQPARRAADADNVNVVVLAGPARAQRPGAPTSTLPGLGQFTTAKLLQLDGNRFNEIRDLGEISMGRPDALANFIEEAAGRFPADKYALTLFDHGAGAQGGYYDTGPPGAVALSVPDIRAGMQAGMARAGIDRFDLLFHAACLMSNYETASALAPLAETMAGSEELMIQYPVSPEGFAPLARERLRRGGRRGVHRGLRPPARRDRHPGRPDLPRPGGDVRRRR